MGKSEGKEEGRQKIRQEREINEFYLKTATI